MSDLPDRQSPIPDATKSGGQIIRLSDHRQSTTFDGGAHVACPKCDNVWWRSPGIVLTAETYSVEAFGYPLECVECGHRLDGDPA